MILRSAGTCVFAVLVHAQTPQQAERPRFEVASIRPTTTKDGSFTVEYRPGGGFFARDVTLRILVQSSYRLEDYQIEGGPGWISSAGFDIEAKGPGNAAAAPENVPRERVNQMLQALLADRFRLMAHRETRERSTYVLGRGKGEPKLRPAEESARGSLMKIGQLEVKKMGMAQLAGILALDLKRPVRDETGLTGDFAFTLEWNSKLDNSDAEQAAKPSIFTAVQDQLGLKLEASKGPVEVLVIESAEKPVEN